MTYASANYDAVVYEQDSPEQQWYVGTNVQVTKKSGSGFTIKSKDGSALFANVVWAFTYAQLKATPYFNIVINNAQTEGASPYMRMFFTLDGFVVELEPFKSEIEGWVTASSRKGSHSLDLGGAYEAMFTVLKHEALDESLIYVQLYVDNIANDTPDPVDVGAMFLSSEQIVPPATPTPTKAPATPTTAPTEAVSSETESQDGSSADEGSAQDESTDESSGEEASTDGSDPDSTTSETASGSQQSDPDDDSGKPWVIIAVIAGVVVLGGIIGALVYKKKKAI
jgi:hypothetical protein